MSKVTILMLTTFVGLAAPAFAQSSGFTGFTTGNLVVSRSVYTGDANTVAVGQALPPLCPVTGGCGSVVAIANGVYPNVWMNDKPDGSFGVTSPIFLDQITPTGTLVNTLAIPTNMVNTSFSSKSEMALNLSTDGTAITLMAYVAPANTVDVSNSNTPGVSDPTNPAGGSFFRGVVQVGPTGSIQVTNTNAYSGNNGRAAVLANGLYYMVGNSNNGGGTPVNVVASAGVQMAVPGQALTSAPTEVGNFSVAQYTNPATGMPFTADKAGKDNNFRGLTIFNSTLYVTKGSGSNGFDTVYQVGKAGTLPTMATAAATPITVLPGFPTVSAKTTTVASLFPFGIWFANATTLYVGDEGDGVVADAAISQTAGLQKWSLVNGSWVMDYVMQNGLNLGQQYSITGYPTALNPATDGLRNITGKVNADGTVTIYAVTSTVSANGDQGADPNKLVAITDVLANTTASGAANETFVTLKAANYGEVLRGVSVTPTALANTTSNVPEVLSAANPGVQTIAPNSLAFVLGQNLATGFPGEIIGPLPNSFGGTTVMITDSSGKPALASLAFVSPSQVTFQVPSGIALGSASVVVTTASGSQQTVSNVQIAPLAPALFTVNGSGLSASYVVHVVNGVQTTQNVYTFVGPDEFGPNPIKVNASGDEVVLVLFGTGIAAAAPSGVQVTAAGTSLQVLYAGPSSYVGLDQIDVVLPASLAGKGTVFIQLTAGSSATAIAANPVQIVVQ